jgi:hypothetical protein
MNSTTRRSARGAAFAACLIALFAGATACGTEDGTATAPAAIGKPATSDNFIKSSKTGQQNYLRQLEAKRDALAKQKQQQFSDDRRQPMGPAKSGPQYPPGLDKLPIQR